MQTIHVVQKKIIERLFFSSFFFFQRKEKMNEAINIPPALYMLLCGCKYNLLIHSYTHTNVKTSVHQGLSLRVSFDNVCLSCIIVMMIGKRVSLTELLLCARLVARIVFNLYCKQLQQLLRGYCILSI